MPKCGSQVVLCDLPIRFDTYEGCSHNCAYCFVSKGYDITKIRGGESTQSLRRFINGERTTETNWCDFKIPIHWGGVSDPFQPVEKHMKRSLEALKVFAETKYPFVVSTKNALISQEPYLSLIKECDCVVQFSACCDKYDNIEKGASTFRQRLEAASIISKYKRVNIRIQPYVTSVFFDVLKNIKLFAEAGVHGVILEGMKHAKKKAGLVKVAGDFVYPYRVLVKHFNEIKRVCHENGLVFYCGENRLRSMSDNLCCCGVEGLGWEVNTANLNHYVFEGDIRFREKMQEGGTAKAFQSLDQTAVGSRRIKDMSFAERMSEEIGRSKVFLTEDGKIVKI